MNVDAWRVARVARQLSETGLYEVSRFPGYPVQEIVCHGSGAAGRGR
jgi:hypothetical protein